LTLGYFITMTASSSILVADDQPAVREALRILLTNEGYRVELAASPREVLRLIREQEFGLALIDLNYARDTTSGEEGLELLQHLQKIEGSSARSSNDRLGHRRSCGRGDEAWRTRFYSKAVG
jgi:CheY-like chemotaxis protein